MGFYFFFGKGEEFVDFLCRRQIRLNLDFPDFVTRIVLPDLFDIPFSSLPSTMIAIAAGDLRFLKIRAMVILCYQNGLYRLLPDVE